MSYDKACTTGSCLKKFLVHFRRGSNYKGEYGFDWVREDYIYKNLKAQKNARQRSLRKRDYKCTENVGELCDILNEKAGIGR